MLLRFKELYKNAIVKDLKNQFNYINPMQIPCIEKISLNMGVGEVVGDSKTLEAAAHDLALIAGQKVVFTMAKKSIAAFKLRKGMPIGCKVTLRKDKMYDFLERLVIVALPRIREFRGFSINSFDSNANLSLGIKEHVIFPEINYDKIYKIFGLNITIVTTANTVQESKQLLSGFYLPFKN
ncbi:50S ribosomal protein L5 [Rickettsiales bacterium Ac37b]|nr:50S ribosomal protein L5 [Rickettsiales bacterium Ac37b]